MATDTNQYKNSPVYGEPKKLDTGKTFRSEDPLGGKSATQNTKEIAPINSGKSS